jgi:hypothetical protein
MKKSIRIGLFSLALITSVVFSANAFASACLADNQNECGYTTTSGRTVKATGAYIEADIEDIIKLLIKK